MKLLFWLLWLLVLTGCTMTPAPSSEPTPAAPTPQTTQVAIQNPITAEQKSQLQYLIQEEKLARDVYMMMDEARSIRKFANILTAEDNHQNRVAQILEVYKIDNPIIWLNRGDFVDPELTQLYDDLVAQWLTSSDQAIQVGIIIERKDIADIQAMLPWFSNNPDITAMLQALLAGSQNHLAAFQK